MSKRNLVLVIALLLVIPALLVGCGGKSDADSIKDSINGFTSAYNAKDYDKCTDYLLDIPDETTREQAKQGLTQMAGYIQSIEVVSIGEPAIDGSSATVKVTAKATLTAALGGGSQDNTIDVPLTKEDGKWKFKIGDLLTLSV